jgi:Thiolase, C-terminal domain
MSFSNFLQTSWFELIEDIGVATLAVIRKLSLDSSWVNASGARRLLRLILSLRRKNEELGIVSLCIGGMGIAVVIRTR